jgi:hypothetical protein
LAHFRNNLLIEGSNRIPTAKQEAILRSCFKPTEATGIDIISQQFSVEILAWDLLLVLPFRAVTKNYMVLGILRLKAEPLPHLRQPHFPLRLVQHGFWVRSKMVLQQALK